MSQQQHLRFFGKRKLGKRFWLGANSCLILISMTGCGTSMNSSHPIASDSYCQTYQKILRVKADGEIMANRGVKERILANEVTYRCLCEGAKGKVCEGKR